MNLSVIANALWAASSLPAFARFRRALQRPEEAQRRILQENLSRNADSAYGRMHGFDSIRTCEEFARRVPLTDYDALEPWIARIRRGEPRVLTCEPVSHLIPTSGSSGARKLIPFTATLQREFNRAIGAWIMDLYRQHPSLALGAHYWSITPAVEMQPGESSAVPIGFDDDSAYLGGLRKRLVDATLAAPAESRHVTDMDAFRYLKLLCLVRRRDLRLISVWHPSFLSLLLDALPGCWEYLLRDLEAGSCEYAKSLPANVRDALKLRPLPHRVQQLRNVDPARPESIWPGLRVISCWGDGHAELAATDLQRRFPNVCVQHKGLLATEAFVTIPFYNERPLAITSHFFEFVDDEGRVRRAHELSKGETYEVVVTTGGGLYRYRLWDQVRVIGFVGQTPSLRFLGRAGNVSDRRGEKLSEAFVAQALAEALNGTGLTPRFALLAPEEDALGARYTLYVEGDVASEVAERLDDALRKNPHYTWCRELGQLQLPRLFRIRGGGYESFVARELARGKRLGEIKPCALSLESDWSNKFEGDYAPQIETRDERSRRLAFPTSGILF